MGESQQPNPKPTADDRAPVTYNYYGDFKYIPTKAPAPAGFWERNSALISGISTISVAIFTGALVLTSFLQWKAIGRQASIAESTLAESSRPWVYPEFTVVSDGLSYPNGVARIVLRVTLRNTGHSVAVDTRIFMRMLLYVGGEDPVDKQTEFIDTVKNAPTLPRPTGVALFPGETNILKDQELLVARDEIERCKRGPSGAIHPIVVGFVQYRFPFRADIDKVHETRFIYEIVRQMGDRMTTPNAYSDILHAEMVFFPSFIGGHEAT